MRGPWCAAAWPMLVLCGCTGELISNLTEERAGNVSVQFINNTDFRASFSFGTYDALDRDPPGAVTLEQLRVEAGASTAPDTLTCRRDTTIGTDEFVERVLATDADEVGDFDADAFNALVHFSDAPIDSDAAALPTIGTADGRRTRLGVDYTCGDLLIFTFNADDAAPGGFRIDLVVVPDVEDDQ